MALTINSFLKRGYIPLSLNKLAGIAWQGELLQDFWMWNRQFTEYKGGIKYIQTVKVTELKEAAIRYWRDGWVPLKPASDGFLRRMEAALRGHQGLKKEGIKFPDKAFLETPAPISEEHMGPEVKDYLGMRRGRMRKLKRKEPQGAIEAYRRKKRG